MLFCLLSIKAHLHQNVLLVQKGCGIMQWNSHNHLCCSFPLLFIYLLFIYWLALFSGLFRKWHHRHCTAAANAISMMVVGIFVKEFFSWIIAIRSYWNSEGSGRLCRNKFSFCSFSPVSDLSWKLFCFSLEYF
jgi:hypothetical protein